MYSNRAIRFTHIFVSCFMVSAAFLPGTALAAESKDAISISSALQLHLIESSGSYVFERDIELSKGDA